MFCAAFMLRNGVRSMFAVIEASLRKRTVDTGEKPTSKTDLSRGGEYISHSLLTSWPLGSCLVKAALLR